MGCRGGTERRVLGHTKEGAGVPKKDGYRNVSFKLPHTSRQSFLVPTGLDQSEPGSSWSLWSSWYGICTLKTHACLYPQTWMSWVPTLLSFQMSSELGSFSGLRWQSSSLSSSGQKGQQIRTHYCLLQARHIPV